MTASSEEPPAVSPAAVEPAHQPIATAVRDPAAEEDGYDFDAFASYSRDPDDDLVAETKRFLESLHRLRVSGVRYLAPLRIWVDKVSLVIRTARVKDKQEAQALTPDLRKVLDDELARCRSLLLFCSRRATRSEWVEHEIEWWLEHRPGPIWLVVTEGANPAGSPQEVFPRSIVSRGLHGFWYDFRGFRDRKLRRGYEQARVNLAADIYGLEKERERVAIAVKLAARKRRLVRIGIAAVVMVALAAVAFGAFRESTLSHAIAKASEARLELARDGDAAKGVETALAAQDTGWFPRPPEVVETLRSAFRASRLRARITAPTAADEPAFASFVEPGPASSPDPDRASFLALSAGRSAWVLDARTWEPIGQPLRLPDALLGAELSADANRLAVASWDEIGVWDRSGGDWSRLSPPIEEPRVHLTSFALRGDGSLVAAGTLLGRVEMWKVGSRGGDPFFDEPHTPPGEEAAGTPVFHVAFSHGGDLLASTGDDGKVRLRREREGRWSTIEPIVHGPVDTKVYRARFSADDRLLVSSGSDGAARLWRIDGDRAEPVATFAHPTEVCDAQVAARGDLIATMTVDGALFLWQTRRPDRPILKLSTAAGAAQTSCSVSFGPAGRLLVTSGQDQVARVWDIDPLVAPEIADLVGPILALAAAPSGTGRNVVAGSSMGDIVSWSGNSGTALALAGRGNELAKLGQGGTVGGNPVTDAALTPSQKIAVTGGGDGQVRVWDIETPALLSTLPSMMDVIRAVAVDSAGGRVAAMTSSALRVTYLGSGGPRQRQMPIEGGVAVAYEPVAGALVAVARSGLYRWDRDQESANQPPSHIDEPGIEFARFAGDLRALVTSGKLGLQVWRTAGAERVGQRINPKTVATNAAVSGDAARVAIVAADAIAVYRVVDGTRAAVLHPAAQATSVAFHPGGTLLVVGELDGRVEVWQPPAAQPVATLLPQDPAEVMTIRYTPDGRQLVTGDRKGRLRMYRLASFAPEDWLLEGEEFAAERHVRDVALASTTSVGSGAR